MIEKTTNQYGQEQKINNLDKIVKIEGKYLQVRLITTKKYNKEEYTKPMPRAKFVQRSGLEKREDFYYLVSKKDLIELVKKGRGEAK